MRKLCIDRITDGIAVLEDEQRQMFYLAETLLPQGCRAGDWLLEQEDGSFVRDEETTAHRRAANKALLDKLLGKNKK